jgi:hypothetical protein
VIRLEPCANKSGPQASNITAKRIDFAKSVAFFVIAVDFRKELLKC